jgi:hypothetical protein
MKTAKSDPKREKVAILWVVALVILPVAMGPAPQKPIKITVDGLNHGPYETQRWEVLEERDASDVVVRQIVYGPGQPQWQILTDGSTQYFHEDALGNVVALSDETGNSVERVVYDTFGKPEFQDPSSNPLTDLASGNFVAASGYGNSNLFRGGWYLPELGLRSNSINTDRGGMYVIGARLYNADEGRFTSGTTPATLAESYSPILGYDTFDVPVGASGRVGLNDFTFTKTGPSRSGWRGSNEYRYLPIRRFTLNRPSYFQGRLLNGADLSPSRGFGFVDMGSGSTAVHDLREHLLNDRSRDPSDTYINIHTDQTLPFRGSDPGETQSKGLQEAACNLFCAATGKFTRGECEHLCIALVYG